MKKCGKAWENQDTKLILDCFTKNGVYQESPLANPYRGHREIARFWNQAVCKETKNIKFKLGKVFVADNKKTGFAEWECINTHKGEKGKMVGIMFLKMKKGKISYLNEYWNTKHN